VYGEAEVAILASRQGLTIEAAARTARYQFLFEQAGTTGAQAVAVGHTADDQVETVLMHFLRGTGLTGLAGMKPCTDQHEWESDLPLLRPLLQNTHAETVAYCEAHALPVVFDQTNLDTTYTRNRLRRELIPYLRQYNPNIHQAILRMSGLLAGDEQLLVALTGDAWQAVCAEQGQDYVILSRSALLKTQIGLRRRLMRIAAEKIQPDMDEIGFETIERAIEFIQVPSASHQLSLAAGVWLNVSGDELLLYRSGSEFQRHGWPLLEEGKEYQLSIPGRLALAKGWVLSAETVEIKNHSPAANDPFTAWLDLRSVSQLTVRTRRPGDRFQPFGMGGSTMKLSDFFINERLNRVARDRWPLIENGDRIVWIPGFRIAEPFRVTQQTASGIYLKLSNQE
jgi:tRNA(Ile)-lysidine synthase